MALYTMKVTEEIQFEVKNIRDAHGNPAQVENARWEASEPDIINVVPDPDDPTNPLKCVARSAHVVDDISMLKFTADGDLGPGVSNLILACDIAVTAGNAVFGEITGGTPREQSPA